jgi:hypothetical protein
MNVYDKLKNRALLARPYWIPIQDCSVIVIGSEFGYAGPLGIELKICNGLTDECVRAVVSPEATEEEIKGYWERVWDVLHA